jgi:hypothetical protein
MLSTLLFLVSEALMLTFDESNASGILGSCIDFYNRRVRGHVSTFDVTIGVMLVLTRSRSSPLIEIGALSRDMVVVTRHRQNDHGESGRAHNTKEFASGREPKSRCDWRTWSSSVTRSNEHSMRDKSSAIGRQVMMVRTQMLR